MNCQGGSNSWTHGTSHTFGACWGQVSSLPRSGSRDGGAVFVAVLGLFGSVDSEKAMQILQGLGANPQESPAWGLNCRLWWGMLKKGCEGCLASTPKNQPLTAVVRILKDATQSSARTIRRVQESPKDTLRSFQSCRILVLACFSLLPERPPNWAKAQNPCWNLAIPMIWASRGFGAPSTGRFACWFQRFVDTCRYQTAKQFP